MHNNRNNNAKYVMRDSDSLTPVFQNKYLLFNLAWQNFPTVGSSWESKPSYPKGTDSCDVPDCKNSYKLYIVSEKDNSGVEKLYAVAGINPSTGKNLQPPANAPKFNLNKTSDNKYILSTSDNKYVAVNSTNELYLTSDQTSSLSLDFNFLTLADNKPTTLINLLNFTNTFSAPGKITGGGLVKTPYNGDGPEDDIIFSLSQNDKTETSLIFHGYNSTSKGLQYQQCSLCTLPDWQKCKICGDSGSSCCPKMPAGKVPLSLHPSEGSGKKYSPTFLIFYRLLFSSFSVYTPQEPCEAKFSPKFISGDYLNGFYGCDNSHPCENNDGAPCGVLLYNHAVSEKWPGSPTDYYGCIMKSKKDDSVFCGISPDVKSQGDCAQTTACKAKPGPTPAPTPGPTPSPPGPGTPGGLCMPSVVIRGVPQPRCVPPAQCDTNDGSPAFGKCISPPGPTPGPTPSPPGPSPPGPTPGTPGGLCMPNVVIRGVPQPRCVPPAQCDTKNGSSTFGKCISPPGPTPAPTPGPTQTSSNSITLILAIGGGVLGLIIIGILIHYAVQKGKTKQKALKVSTNSN